MKKMMMAFAFAGALAFSSNAAAASYVDLTETSRFYDEIMFLTERGIATESTPNRFGSEEGVTRETVAVMISRSLDLPLKGQAAFKDVPATSDASAHIEAARAKGILSGYPDGTFRPNEKVDRSQLALFLNRAFAYEGAAKGSFTDVGPNMKAYEHIQRLVAARITGGFPDGTYRPNEVVTRGQFAAFLARSLDDSFVEKVPVPKPVHKQPMKTSEVTSSLISWAQLKENNGLSLAYSAQKKVSDALTITYVSITPEYDSVMFIVKGKGEEVFYELGRVGFVTIMSEAKHFTIDEHMNVQSLLKEVKEAHDHLYN